MVQFSKNDKFYRTNILQSLRSWTRPTKVQKHEIRRESTPMVAVEGDERPNKLLVIRTRK